MAFRITVSHKYLNHLAAMHSDTQSRLRREAASIEAKAQANKAGHVEAGHLHVENEGHVVGRGKWGRIDYFVSLIDPNAANNDVAVHAIEYGHPPGGWYAEMEGARWVEGLYILSRAAGLV